MSLILENTDQVPYFTNMRLVLLAVGISATNYDWYISDIETNYGPEKFSSEDRWMPGEELNLILEGDEIQFIWAVFSAVPKGYRHAVEYSPYVDGNPQYWTGDEPIPQLPGALFDSSQFLFFLHIVAGRCRKEVHAGLSGCSSTYRCSTAEKWLTKRSTGPLFRCAFGSAPKRSVTFSVSRLVILN